MTNVMVVLDDVMTLWYSGASILVLNRAALCLEFDVPRSVSMSLLPLCSSRSILHNSTARLLIIALLTAILKKLSIAWKLLYDILAFASRRLLTCFQVADAQLAHFLVRVCARM